MARLQPCRVIVDVLFNQHVFGTVAQRVATSMFMPIAPAFLSSRLTRLDATSLGSDRDASRLKMKLSPCSVAQSTKPMRRNRLCRTKNCRLASVL
jgi:hypothetical protein